MELVHAGNGESLFFFSFFPPPPTPPPPPPFCYEKSKEE